MEPVRRKTPLRFIMYAAVPWIEQDLWNLIDIPR
jgi:hypothetical protein